MQPIVVLPQQGTCQGCGEKDVPVYAFYSADNIYFVACNFCFIEAMQYVRKQQQGIVLVLKDLLFRTREALVRPVPLAERRQLLEEIDVNLAPRQQASQQKEERDEQFA